MDAAVVSNAFNLIKSCHVCVPDPTPHLHVMLFDTCTVRIHVVDLVEYRLT